MERQVKNIALLTSDQLASYAEIASMYGRGKEARKIPISKVFIRAGFNHRIDFGDIRLLADFLLSGGDVPPIVVDILKETGEAILIEGERRVRSHQLLVSEGHEQFSIIHAFVSPRTLSEQERVIRSIASNNNKQWEPLELAEGFKDLREVYGMSNADIAKATGYNTMHVSNQLRLAGITDEEKELIREGKVSSTAVLDMVKSGISPGARLDAVKEAAGNGGDGKKGKLKIKDVEIMGDLKPSEFDPNQNPLDILKSIKIHISALNRLIGTDSKMSDITFKIEDDLRNLKKLIEPTYSASTISREQAAADLLNEAFDPLFAEAAVLVVKNQMGSTSLLQRVMQLGYMRANRIMTQLEKAKVVGQFIGNAPRQIFFTDVEQLKIALDVILKDAQYDEQPF